MSKHKQQTTKRKCSVGRACGFVIKRSLSACLSARRLRSTHSCRTGATMNLFVATACMTHTITPPSLMMTIPHPVVAIHAARVAAPHTQHVAEVGEILFPSTLNVAFIQPPGLGAPKASQANPGGAGNAVRCCLLSRALAVALLKDYSAFSCSDVTCVRHGRKVTGGHPAMCHRTIWRARWRRSKPDRPSTSRMEHTSSRS